MLGDPTEGSLLVAAAKAGIELAAWRQAAPRAAELNALNCQLANRSTLRLGC